jgi:CheY-like chemotaxis protein
MALMPSHQGRSMQAPPQQPLDGIQILLVEDALNIAELLLVMFQGAEATVRLCMEAEAALMVLEAFQPDVLVINIKLPSHDGMWLVRQIRNNPRPEIRSLPAMGVTSYNREVHADDALVAGFDCFFSKLDTPDAVQPYTEELPYCVCKAGLLNLAKGLSKAYGKDGVLVNTVSPAFIATPIPTQ